MPDETVKTAIDDDFTADQSPLTRIKQKEIEINTRILEASREADEIVAEARRQAAIIKERAEGQGYEEAKALYKLELAKAKKEAAKVEKSVDEEVAKTTEQGTKNLQKAVDFIVEVVAGSSVTADT